MESEIKPERCPTCKDWRAFRVLKESSGAMRDLDERSDLPANPPAICPDCGWQPGVVEIRYVSRPIGPE